jgi:hypothetical protein
MDRESDFLRNVWLVELRAPPPVIGLDEGLHCVVQQTSQHDLQASTISSDTNFILDCCAKPYA